MALIIFASLGSIVTFVGWIRVSWLWVWWVMFLVFRTLFIFIIFFDFGFAVIAVIIWIRFVLAHIFAAIAAIRQIRFAWWRVYKWWVWIQVRWYLRFSFLIWWFRWLCLRSGLQRSCFNRNWVQLWRCSVCCVCINRSWFQRWLTHWNISAPKVLIFYPNLTSVL